MFDQTNAIESETSNNEMTVPAWARLHRRQEPRGHAEPAHVRFGDAAIRTQAREALVALGWKPGTARAATDAAIRHVGTDVPIEALIRAALRRCPKPLG